MFWELLRTLSGSSPAVPPFAGLVGAAIGVVIAGLVGVVVLQLFKGAAR